MTGGGLLRSHSSKKGAKLHWDEGNLAENEKIKDELKPIKITEPKTPYRRTVDADSDDEMHPVPHEQPEEAVLGGNGVVASASTVAKFWDDLDLLHNKRQASSDDWHSDSGGSHSELHPDSHSEEVEGKRRKFNESRKEHYGGAREALRKARQLLEQEQRQEGEDEDDDVDAAHAKAVAGVPAAVGAR